MRDLDAREARFVEEYLKDLDPKRAALGAGYSKTVAASKAYQWVSNGKVKPHVFAAILRAQEKRSRRTEIDADWVLRRLADEATADLADILDEAGAVKPVADWPLIWRQGLVSGVDVHEEVVEGQKVGQTVKIKLSDRIRRIELIGRHVDVGAFRERVELTGKDGGPVQVEEVSARDVLADRLARIAAKSGSSGDTGGSDGAAG